MSKRSLASGSAPRHRLRSFNPASFTLSLDAHLPETVHFLLQRWTTFQLHRRTEDGAVSEQGCSWQASDAVYQDEAVAERQTLSETPTINTTDLACLRTALALDRTLTAWMRTAFSMIGLRREPGGSVCPVPAGIDGGNPGQRSRPASFAGPFVRTGNS